MSAPTHICQRSTQFLRTAVILFQEETIEVVIVSRRPGIPHRHDQYIAEINNATGETPMPEPNTNGSMSWLAI
jgi:hypothetical protein